jgi:hypothetical protein
MLSHVGSARDIEFSVNGHFRTLRVKSGLQREHRPTIGPDARHSWLRMRHAQVRESFGDTTKEFRRVWQSTQDLRDRKFGKTGGERV